MDANTFFWLLVLVAVVTIISAIVTYNLWATLLTLLIALVVFFWLVPILILPVIRPVPAPTTGVYAPVTGDAGTSTGTTGGTVLTTGEVQSWCKSGDCSTGRFEQVVETNGVRNPRAVHVKGGNPSSFEVPGGITYQNWDCFTATTGTGPILLTVCEATFRR